MPSLVFYIGYTNLHAPMYGSEIALHNLALALSKFFQVFIFTPFHPPNHVLNLNYLSVKDYLENDFDYLIISRYVNAFVHIPIRASKTFLWLHDVVLQPSFNGGSLPESGRWLLANTHYDGIVLQSEWHRQTFQRLYPEAHSLFVLGNGLELSYFKPSLAKVPYRFMWSSSPVRGLTTMLTIFETVLTRYPQASLHVCRGREEMTPEQLQMMEKLSPAVVYRGKLSNYQVAQEFLEADIWLYPTDFAETFCISALEAQAAGCVPISTDLAALEEMNYLGGLVSTQSLNRNNEFVDFIDTLFREERKGLLNYLESKTPLIQEWVQTFSWQRRAIEWKNLLEKGSFSAPLVTLSSKERQSLRLLSEPSQEVSADKIELIIYVLNLAKRQDRMKHMQELLSQYPHNRFEAVNGEKVVANEWIKQILGNRNAPKKNPYPWHHFQKGVVGCALSHFHLWVLAAERNFTTVILEDDLQLHSNFFSSFPLLMTYLGKRDNWDICFLGYLDDVPFYQDEVVETLSAELKLRRFNPTSARKHGGGTHGYCLSPRGAKKLLKLVEEYGIAQPVDWFLIEMFSEMVALKCDPHLVEPDSRWGSDIQ